MLGIKVGLDHSTIMAILAFIGFLWAIMLCMLEAWHQEQESLGLTKKKHWRNLE
jgi:hypothetical protein